MTVYIIVNEKKARALDIAQKAAVILSENGAKIIMTEAFNNIITCENIIFTSESNALLQCDVIITIGGDGTILRAARKNLPFKKPILGINVGHLGFLANIEQNELHLLKNVVTGEFKLDERSILNVITSQNKNKSYNAFNEVVIGKHSISQTIDVFIYCDDILVSNYRGDGVIIATPTGSTAYSLSAGGPMLDALVYGIVVTPLCAHSMNNPPMVFSASRKIRVKTSGVASKSVVFSCDGQKDNMLEENEDVLVSLSEEKMTLITLREAQQFNAIHKKLKGR